MGVDKFYRKAVGPKAAWRDTINVLKGSLSATSGNGGVYSAENPLGSDIIVTEVIVDIATECSATPVTFDAGCAAADATTSDDNLLDEVEIGTPTSAQVYNSSDDAGSNGALARKWESDKYFTVTASATPTGITGNVYIYYRKA